MAYIRYSAFARGTATGGSVPVRLNLLRNHKPRRVQIATGEDRLVQFGIGARAARQRTRQRAFCVVSGSSRASVSTTREPLNNVGGAPVGRKNGVENMCYYPVFYYEREAL
jgi:hypothetical protein